MVDRGALRRLRRHAATTPGTLSIAATVLVTIGLVAGLISLVTIRQRADLVRDVGSVSGPLSVQAQNLYRSLSDADATAANAFLANGAEPAAMRQRYLDDIAQATAALAVALRDAEGEGAASLAVIADQLPVYTGLVETARSYNRQEIPLGAAYLREASALMRQILLPAAQRLFEVEQQRLITAQRDAADFPWRVLMLGLLVLGGLVGAQVLLRRRTNRVFNLGLVGATAALLVSCGWATVALAGSAGDVSAGRGDGSALVRILADARVAALQARADEALTLIARGGDGGAFETDFQNVLKRLTDDRGLLARATATARNPGDRATIDEARKAADQWLDAHRRMHELTTGGRYTDAVALATGTAQDGPTVSFARLDAALTKGITDADATFDRRTAGAREALDGTDAGVGLLTGLLVIGVVVGMARRIGEYR